MVYVAHTDSNFDGSTLTAVVNGFQQSETLLIGEIWAIPAILRFILLENLRRISDRVDRSRRDARRSQQVCGCSGGKVGRAGSRCDLRR